MTSGTKILTTPITYLAFMSNALNIIDHWGACFGAGTIQVVLSYNKKHTNVELHRVDNEPDLVNNL